MTRIWNRPARMLCTGALACSGVIAGAAAGMVGSGIAGPVAAGAASAAGGCGAGSLTLSVEGKGTVATTPNVLTLTLQVSASAGNPGQALQSDDTLTSAVVSALTSGGLASKDIQTTDLSVQPTYAGTPAALTGYQADTTVVATIREFSSAGQLVSQAVTAGGTGTTIESLSFSVTNPLAAQDQARRSAVRQAVNHATSMASAAGERLGRLCSLKDESSTTSTTPPVPVFGTASRAGLPSQPVQPGSQTVTARVALVYLLVPEPPRHHHVAATSATGAP